MSISLIFIVGICGCENGLWGFCFPACDEDTTITNESKDGSAVLTYLAVPPTGTTDYVLKTGEVEIYHYNKVWFVLTSGGYLKVVTHLITRHGLLVISDQQIHFAI